MRSLRRGLGFLLMATLVLSACGGGDGAKDQTRVTGPEHDEHADHGSDEEAPFPLSEADVTVKVSMKDFAFAGLPPAVDGEKVLFEVTNLGPSEHEFVLFEKGGSDALRGIKPFAKGKTEMLALELKPGSYTAKCLVEVGDRTHADLGMQTDFTVG